MKREDDDRTGKWKGIGERTFFLFSQNVAICPKTFSNRIDSYYKWHAGLTSSDVSPIKVQSQLIVYDHWNRRTTVGRAPLDEWSARRRDLYLTTHNTHNRQTSMPPVGFEPTISAGERPQTYALDRAATATGYTHTRAHACTLPTQPVACGQYSARDTVLHCWRRYWYD